jgi:hypothetical protein
MHEIKLFFYHSQSKPDLKVVVNEIKGEVHNVGPNQVLLVSKPCNVCIFWKEKPVKAL